MKRQDRRTFTSEFKQQMVNLYNNGKPRSEIIKEYELSPSALGKWIQQANSTGSFKHVDNLTDDQVLLKKLEKENKQLKMENDILKQAALIMGRK